MSRLRNPSFDIRPVIQYIAVFGFFMFFLGYLIFLAKRNANKPKKRPKKTDSFFKENGYGYDYVMVFEVYDEAKKESLNAFQKKYSMKSCVDRIQMANMESRSFYSCQRDEVYLKIRASPDRLKKEANRIEYKLLLDKERLRIRCNAGGKSAPPTWKGFNIIDEKRVSKYGPYEHIYGKYKIDKEYQSLYTLYEFGETEAEQMEKLQGKKSKKNIQNPKKHIFRGVDR